MLLRLRGFGLCCFSCLVGGLLALFGGVCGVLSGWCCGGGFGRVVCVAGLFGYLWYCGSSVFVL